jgi:hypothetical protein
MGFTRVSSFFKRYLNSLSLSSNIMKKGLMFAGLFLLSFILVGSFGVVSAIHNDNGLNPNDFFYCHDSDEHIDFTNATTTTDGKTIGGIFELGLFNYQEKGETYGKEKLYSDEFVTKTDNCVITESIQITEESLISEEIDEDTKKLLAIMMTDEETLGKEIENAKRLKKIQELRYNGGGIIYFPPVEYIDSEGRTGYTNNFSELFLIRCVNGDCDSAKVNLCGGGDNCRVLENSCTISATGNDYFKLLFSHPLQAARLLFGDTKAMSISSVVSVESCENGCSNGACIKS